MTEKTYRFDTGDDMPFSRRPPAMAVRDAADAIEDTEGHILRTYPKVVEDETGCLIPAQTEEERELGDRLH